MSNKIIQFNEDAIKQELGNLVRQSVEDTLNALLDEEGDVITTLKLNPLYENASDLMAKIVELNSDPVTTRNAIQAAGIPSFGSLENLLNAYDTVYRYLKDKRIKSTNNKHRDRSHISRVCTY